MESSDFYKYLGGVIAVAIAGLLLLSKVLSMHDHKLLGWLGLVFFIVLSIVIFMMGKAKAGSKDSNAFTRLIMYNLMIKMFSSVCIVFIYYVVTKPMEKLFIIPFVFIYFLFTIFEVFFLTRLSSQS